MQLVFQLAVKLNLNLKLYAFTGLYACSCFMLAPNYCVNADRFFAAEAFLCSPFRTMFYVFANYFNDFYFRILSVTYLSSNLKRNFYMDRCIGIGELHTELCVFF